MARPLRLEYPGAVWHITSRGNERRNIFLDDEDRLKFLSLLARCITRHDWILHAWVLMSNHFHLVLETPQCTLSRGMQWLNGCYAQYFNRKYGRRGHLFEGRFKGILVDSNQYFLEVCRYTILNPVRAGMVETASDYLWSSYRATAGLDPTPGWLSVAPLLGRLGGDPMAARELYARFVNDGLRVPSPWEKISGQMYLGGPAFLRFVQGIIDAEPRSDEHPRAMREVGCPSMGEIAEVVAQSFETTPNQILTGRGGLARTAFAHLGWHQGRLRLAQIATGLRLRSHGYVSTLVRRAESDLATDPYLRDRLDSCRQLLRRPPPSSVLAPL